MTSQRLEIKEITDANFVEEVLNHPTPVLVLFHTTYCGSCKDARPLYEIMARRFEGRVKFVALDTDTGHKYAQLYGVVGHPYAVVIQNGGMKNANDYYSGFATVPARYEAMINRALGLPFDPSLLYH